MATYEILITAYFPLIKLLIYNFFNNTVGYSIPIFLNYQINANYPLFD